jgi:dolichol kinase
LLLGLIYVGHRHRNPAIWGGLALVILWWVPQDIFISLQKNAWSHVWVDLFAAIVLVIPLLYLWCLDRKQAKG